MRPLLQDIRSTLRGLGNNPIFALFAIVSLALGIGATVAIFSATRAVLLHPLPVEEPSRLVALYTTNDGTTSLLPLSHSEYRDLLEGGGGVFSDLSLDRSAWVTLAGDGGAPERVRGALVAADHFEILGLKAEKGRFFSAAEGEVAGGEPVAVLGYDFWRRRFGGDPGIVGRTVSFNDRAFTVVGVAPQGFRGLNVLYPREVWFPLGSYRYVLSGTLRDWVPLRDGRIFRGIARLQPGVSIQGARQAVATLGRRLAEQYPETNEGVELRLMPLLEATINPNQRGSYLRTGVALVAVAGLLMLIAAANVANLLLVRAAARRQEVAVRLSLGVSRRRLIRQLLTEGLILALLGGGLGLALGYAFRHLLWVLRPPIIPDSLSFDLDPTVLLFALGLCLVVAVLFALAPLSQMLKVDLVSAFKGRGEAASAGGSRIRMRNLLVAAQVALSLVALASASIFITSVRRAQTVDLGFASDHLVVASFDLGTRGYEEPRARELFRQMVERSRSLPGVAAAALSERVALVPYGFLIGVEVEGREAPPDDDGSLVYINTIGEGYFEALGVPITRGRTFNSSDRPGSRRVAVINRTLAQRFWPDRDPLQQRFRFSGEEEPLEVVGVAGDSVVLAVGEDPAPQVYLPLEQSFAAEMSLLIRTTSDPAPLVPMLRKEIQGLDDGLAFLRFDAFGSLLREAFWPGRLAAQLLTLFGLIALVLTTVGIYGVVAYVVHQRRQEVGVRMALGGGRADILKLFLRQGSILIVSGLLFGAVLTHLAMLYLRSLLVGLDSLPIGSFALAAGLELAIAVLAVAVAARRATLVDPRVALRSEL